MILVFDVGASHTRLALSRDGVTFAKIERMPTDRSARGPAELVLALKRLAAAEKPQAVVGGMAGQISANGHLSGAHNLTEWNGQDVRGPLERAFGCEVTIKNDVVMGGLGEATSGAGSAHGVMAYFTISSGVNAVRVVDGRVDETIRQFDLGRQIVPGPDGGAVPLEELAGGEAFKARTAHDPHEVRDGRTWRGVEHHLAAGLFNALLYWTPDVVVLGGSMMADIDPTDLADELTRLAGPDDALPPLVRASLGDEGGIYGALAWARQTQK